LPWGPRSFLLARLFLSAAAWRAETVGQFNENPFDICFNRNTPMKARVNGLFTAAFFAAVRLMARKADCGVRF
jgi:hypothetical protein